MKKYSQFLLCWMIYSLCMNWKYLVSMIIFIWAIRRFNVIDRLQRIIHFCHILTSFEEFSSPLFLFPPRTLPLDYSCNLPLPILSPLLIKILNALLLRVALNFAFLFPFSDFVDGIWYFVDVIAYGKLEICVQRHVFQTFSTFPSFFLFAFINILVFIPPFFDRWQHRVSHQFPL